MLAGIAVFEGNQKFKHLARVSPASSAIRRTSICPRPSSDPGPDVDVPWFPGRRAAWATRRTGRISMSTR